MKISILSSDGLVFMVEESIAVQFPGITSILDMLGNLRDDLRLPVRVNSWVLPKMIKYFERQTEEGPGAKALKEFDSSFADELEKDHSLLFGVLEAACSMEMDELIHLLCNEVATMT